MSNNPYEILHKANLRNMTKNKLLYIGSRINKPKDGADQVNMRNQKLLETIFKDGVDYVSSSKPSLLNKLFLGVTNNQIDEIDNQLKSGEYKKVFISQSLFGRAVKHIKTNYPEVLIYTFFHNIEIQYAAEYRKTAGLKSLPFYVAVKHWERICCKYTDVFITLNKRDSDLLRKIYGKHSNMELPTSFDDKFDQIKAECINASDFEPIDYLFVGVAFFANIQGVQWFIDNVIPYVEGHFHVVGKDMDKVEWKNLTPNVHIHGFVDDLSEYYYRARIVVSPIFVGGGMKTKTAEALMYGKTILGTSEAFEGYEINANCMKLCQNEQEFVKSCQEQKNAPLLCLAAREIFTDHYSNDIALHRLSKILK